MVISGNKMRLFLLILLAVDFIWVRSSIGKVMGGTFVDSLEGILTKFASQNPYPWYKAFLTSVAIPNSTLLGTMIMIGEAFAAFSILLGVSLILLNKINKFVIFLLILGLLTGTILNLNFWLASGWTSPSADSLNLLMMLIEIIGAIYVIGLYKSKTPIVS